MNLATSTLVLALLGVPPASSNEQLCARREPCQVLETLDAGQDVKGQPMQVKKLSLGWLDFATASNATGRKFGAGRQAEGRRENGQCEATEWWLLRSSQPAQLLLAVCNDGYGAAGLGEDGVTVGENLFTHTQSGGSAERWSVSRTLQLSPLTLVRDSLRSFRPHASEERGDWWDVTQLRGEALVPAPSCPEGQSSLGERTLPYLPLVQVEPSYLKDGWKQTGLGTCALDAGHFVLGTRDDPKDAALKALLASRETLLIEVRDNRWTGPSGEKWLADDHVELWLGPQPPQELSGCGQPSRDERPVQWGIRLADGKVFPAYGSPKQKLKVERVELRGPQGLEGYRLKVTLPKGFRGVSVVYSDSDAGQKQERMLATSPLKFARPETLNAVRLVLPVEATCGVRDGGLTVAPSPLQVQGPDVAALFSP
jgi:hypothetical protein